MSRHVSNSMAGGALSVRYIIAIRQAVLQNEGRGVLSRRAVSPPITHPKLQVIILANFAIYPPDILTQLDGAEACIWTLGIKTASVPDQRLVSVTCSLALTTALTQLHTPPSHPSASSSPAARSQSPTPTPPHSSWAPRAKSKARLRWRSSLLQRARRIGRIEEVVTRPAMVHAPGSVVGGLMSGLPAGLRGVGMKELAAVTLDIVRKWGDEGKAG
ncbi:hypothetical protein VC83_05389 [Pseudogymnoascus destructans]|uniref:Uncharacterized protein n=1 Tax=Pseudogymnoascus destructans TaxID=655981 RepID=A0A177A9V0_9PEZI|nr:uncharacterized protein VC83_05389 [Pseudogymnoascus destructans]OAF57953.1 hypothetical protein VC83_05389 [Pseudogymnoascus destructans]